MLFRSPIAFAQTYFAVQTRKQEIIERRLAEAERVSARKKRTRSERELSRIIFDTLRENQSFARIRSKGDTALFRSTISLPVSQTNSLAIEVSTDAGFL